ncbi:MAG: divergent polysaccharide deacetylase family protein [Proteobacteria bacterium]|nr:divergent polysaccharide deacetylase family protein [Pseudomonadota bacterium]MDA1059374.1 divergent polysaccharide deacetylase family protein [Pseudomonadota bacterium]
MARSPRSLRAGRRLTAVDETDTPIWRTAPALVAYGLVGLLVAGVVLLQVTYVAPGPVADQAEDGPTVVSLSPPTTEPAAPPPVESDDAVSEAAPTDAPSSDDQADVALPAAPPARQQVVAPTPQQAAAAAPQPTALPRTAVPSAALPALPRKLVLAPAPEPALLVAGRFGPLPVIADDGREAWRVYARPFPQERDRPRIAILMQDLGLSQEQTNAAIQQLPGSVSLGFTPYARRLDQWIALSRAAGHEVLLQVPMEPFDFPTSDPGPHTLLTSAGADENLERLEFLLSRFSGYVGVYNRMGDRFTSSTESLRPVLQSLRERGLLFIDARTSGTSVAGRIADDLGLPHALNNREIDQVASRVAIDAKLIDLENIARQEGQAIGIGRPYPVTLERLAQWAAGLEAKGIDLAPISAMIARDEQR